MSAYAGIIKDNEHGRKIRRRKLKRRNREPRHCKSFIMMRINPQMDINIASPEDTSDSWDH